MCKPASFVLTKENIYWSRFSDSHEEIIKEHNLREGKSISILRVEINPPDGDMRKPLDEWVFRYDQDTIPEWADKNANEKRTRKELKTWFDTKVIIDGSRECKIGEFFAYNSSTVTAYGSSTVTAYNSSTVTAYGSSTVTAYNSSTVTACGSSTVTAYGSSTVMAYNSSNLIYFSNGKYTLSDSSVCIDRTGDKLKMAKAKKARK